MSRGRLFSGLHACATSMLAISQARLSYDLGERVMPGLLFLVASAAFALAVWAFFLRGPR